MGAVQEVKVPDIGDFSDVEIIEVVVSPGDQVSEEDPLITLESDKASMEVPSPHAGTIVDVMVGVGDRVSEGSVIVSLEVGDDGAAEAPDAERRGRARRTAGGGEEGGRAEENRAEVGNRLTRAFQGRAGARTRAQVQERGHGWRSGEGSGRR